MACTIEFGGASRVNPGKAGAGAIIREPTGVVRWRLCQGLGDTTNIAAQYQALILGLRIALREGYTRVRAQTDSHHVCNQVLKLWPTMDSELSTLNDQVQQLGAKFQSFQIVLAERDCNAEAEAEAMLALELKDGQIEEEHADSLEF